MFFIHFVSYFSNGVGFFYRSNNFTSIKLRKTLPSSDRINSLILE